MVIEPTTRTKCKRSEGDERGGEDKENERPKYVKGPIGKSS
jgi:hypothetical protein